MNMPATPTPLRFSNLAWLLGGLAMAAAPHAERLPAWISVIALTLLCWHSAIFCAVARPASAAAIVLLRPFGARMLSIVGFLFIAATFAALAAAYAAGASATTKFALYVLLSFAINWGPNVSTYVCPAEAFPARVRGTLHGVSAAAGKLGAVIGTFIFAPIVSVWGVAGVLWVQVALSLLGAVASVVFLPAAPVDDDDDTAGDKLGAAALADDGPRARLLIDA